MVHVLASCLSHKLLIIELKLRTVQWIAKLKFRTPKIFYKPPFKGLTMVLEVMF